MQHYLSLRQVLPLLQRILTHPHQSILTFGGAFSNHIAATAHMGTLCGLQTIGIIRGEEAVSSSSQTKHLCGVFANQWDNIW